MGFEEDLKRLEDIVKTLEKGEVSLEESLNLFEEGIKLSKKLKTFLQDAERKVRILVESGEGIFSEEPFSLGDEED